jgi:glucuronate isomerase
MIQGRRGLLMRLPLLGAVSASGQTARSGSLEGRLLAELGRIETVNTHEHIIPEQERIAKRVDFFSLAQHYFFNDMVSAGLSGESLKLVSNRDAPTAERWRAYEPYWKAARLTGYGQALRITIRDIYGVEEISGKTVERINAALRERNKPGIYRYVLKERSRIRFSVVDDYWNAGAVRPDPEFFVLAHKFDRFVQPWTPEDLRRLEQVTGVSIPTLRALKQALQKNFQQCLDAGMVTVKTTLAYDRELHFREVNEADAARDFERMAQGGQTLPEGFRRKLHRPFRNLEDHMFHEVLRLADAAGIPIQIHTGIHAGNGNFITNTNPTLLNNLFFLYPRLKFDLFHISYPYEGELSVLAKHFPNVYVDFCWAHIVSPAGARRALDEMLEMIPANKISGFGGDYQYAELSYGHLQIARRNIAQVLAAKTQAGFCKEEEALEIGRMLMHDNPANLFARRE